MMPRTSRALGLAAVSMLAAGLGSAAAGQNTLDRQADQIAVVAKAGDPAGTYRISVAWGIDATTSTTLTAGSVLTLARNGSTIWTSTVAAIASVGGGCSVCAPGTLCICVSGGPCACGPCANGGTGVCTASLATATELPNPVALVAGDTLTFTIAAASGATPDQLTANNVKTLTFNGTQTFWNRRLIAAELVPSDCPGASDLYDLHYTIAYDFSGLSGSINLATSFDLRLNGVAFASFDACHNNPWITTGVSCGTQTCGTSECGSGSCAGANVDLDCQQVEMPGTGLTSCVCSSGKLTQIVRGIAIPGLETTDGIDMLVQVTQMGGPFGAIAEIPLLAADDLVQVPFTVAPAACNADLNKDGKVDAGDLAIMLGAWGDCR